jgi:hypothetical protein
MKQLSLFKKAGFLKNKYCIFKSLLVLIFMIASLSIQAQGDIAGEMDVTKKPVNNPENPGSADMFVDADFKLYPNPASDIIHIQSKVKLKEGVILTLYDIRGTLLEKKVLGSIITTADYSFNLGKYSGGQYIIGILSIDGSFVAKKLIKQG